MRGALLVMAVTVGTTGVAQAEDYELYDRLWPQAPISQRLKLSQQIIEELTDLGNTLGFHVGQLSNDMIGLELDARARRARIRVGGGDYRYLQFELDSDVTFVDGAARVITKLEVGVAGRVVRIELPEYDVVPASYRGERGVEIRVPLFRRTF